MPLANLASNMHSKGFVVIHDKNSVIEKLIHHLDEKFHAIIKHNDGHFKIEVFKTQRDSNGLYTREEYLECKEVKEKLIDHINGLDLGISFNKVGSTKTIWFVVLECYHQNQNPPRKKLGRINQF